MKRKEFPFCLRWLGLPWQHTTDWVASIMGIFFLTLLEAGGPRSRCWHIWFLMRTLFLASTFLLCPHKITIPSPPSWGPTIVTSSKSTYLTKILPPNTILFGGRASTYELGAGGYIHSQYSLPCPFSWEIPEERGLSTDWIQQRFFRTLEELRELLSS